MATLQFRVATADDASLIHPLVESAYRGDESKLGWTTEADLVSGKRIDAEGLLAKITAADGAVLIATCADDTSEQPFLVACCEVVRRSPQVAYFGMFAVSPRRQGGGIGRQVMAHAEEFCRREWGAEKMEMTVISSRQELLDWYKRRGYAHTGESRPFPFEELEKLNSVALVDNLGFDVLEKDLRVDGAKAIVADVRLSGQ
ncbi:acyl-CoA N-acyltransferase [Staphylotrichum tortipilum]|uniref:Acyl-CoA N-acyltransferase n=1 Tax=Staphylotrichum tortipilum TaxID=2831512 RepID=A0AAN6MHW7_9PEZI|nr:acyl-CoA N-acyltransferase [Staphylotrichum longicolle]